MIVVESPKKLLAAYAIGYFIAKILDSGGMPLNVSIGEVAIIGLCGLTVLIGGLILL